MSDVKLPMGKKIRTHFGYFEFDSEIMEIGIEDDQMSIETENAIYYITKRFKVNETDH